MRKWAYALAGIALFAAGIALGVGLSRMWIAEQPPGRDQPSLGAEQPTAWKAKAATQSVTEDEAALIGLWVHEEENALLRIRRKDSLWAYVLRTKGVYLDFSLEARHGRRVLVEEQYDTDGDHQNPLYEYQLRGDRLELKLLPGAAAKFAEDKDCRILDDLGGAWYRVRINKDAEPDRGGGS